MATTHYKHNNFSYRDALGRQGLCQIERFVGENIVVVVTELEENTGPSITNAFEQIATQLVQSSSWLKSEKDILWIEHYQHRDGEETWDQVKMDYDDMVYSNPKWEPISGPDAKALMETMLGCVEGDK
jgi:hypothetical protein